MSTRTLMTAVAAVAILVGAAGVANAYSDSTTVSTTTYTQTVPMDGVTMVNFSAFDLNQDGIYTKDEVGERLFRVFDQDGNHMIDNTEWDVRNVMTIKPMESTTIRTIDYGSDGRVDQATESYSTFVQQSGLARFASSPDGLSAHDFLDIPFNVVDTSGNYMVELNEWKTAYNKNNLTTPVRLDYPQDSLVRER